MGGQETVEELCAKLRRMFQLLQNVQLVDMNQWVIEISKESTRGKKKTVFTFRCQFVFLPPSLFASISCTGVCLTSLKAIFQPVVLLECRCGVDAWICSMGSSNEGQNKAGKGQVCQRPVSSLRPEKKGWTTKFQASCAL